MGLLSGLLGGGDSPSLNVVPLDSGTQNLIAGQYKNANSDVAGKLNAGVGAAGAQGMQTQGQATQRAAQTGEDPAMMEAIRNQYNKSASQGINRIVSSNNTNSSMVKAQWMDQAAKSAIAQQQVQTQNFAALTDAMNQADMARAQVLSSVLGVAGMGAGMYMAGRKGKPPAQTQAEFRDTGSPGEEYQGQGNSKFNSSFF